MKTAGDEPFTVVKNLRDGAGQQVCGPKSFRSVIVHAGRALVISECGSAPLTLQR